MKIIIKRLKFLLKTILRIIYYIFSNEKRYLGLLILILYYRPKKILEIGVYNGRRSIQMIEAAKVFESNIEYYGFDLFENLSSHILKTEASKKPTSMKKIRELLSNHAQVFLYKGFTKNTLKNFIDENKKIDFVFIDGGHSVDTIKDDYENSVKASSNNSIIVFDDYYNPESIDINKFGSNMIYKELKEHFFKPKFLPFKDKYYENGKIKAIKMFFVKINKFKS
tara:strand:- start:812 stop:1483 length:672 start_codon:yes stop_codon:yes gene_type:complete